MAAPEARSHILRKALRAAVILPAMPIDRSTAPRRIPVQKEAPDHVRLRWLDQATAPRAHGSPGAWRPGLRRTSVASEVRSRLFVEDVKTVVARQIEEHLCTPAEVAQELGISVRTLSWRLAKEDTSYREIHLAARIAYALKVMTEPSYSLSDCASMCGFRLNSAFSNWCSRVLGAPPGVVRDHILGARFARKPEKLRAPPRRV